MNGLTVNETFNRLFLLAEQKHNKLIAEDTQWNRMDLEISSSILEAYYIAKKPELNVSQKQLHQLIDLIHYSRSHQSNDFIE